VLLHSNRKAGRKHTITGCCLRLLLLVLLVLLMLVLVVVVVA
jgi:hypothetical protein